MGFHLARGLIAHLISFALILQALEIFRMLKFPEVLAIWSETSLGDELESSFPFGVGRFLKSDLAFGRLAAAQIGLASFAFLFPSVMAFVFLLITHLLVCARFRGSVNGGSDAMTVVVLTGLIVSFATSRDSAAQLGLIYISIHLLFSYLKSGVSKLRRREWRDGEALPAFLAQSLFADSRAFAAWLKTHPRMSLGLCWLTILFELSAVLAVFAPVSVGLILSVVVVFHFTIYLAFGLNRFFWVWLSAWPAVFFLSQRLVAA